MNSRYDWQLMPELPEETVQTVADALQVTPFLARLLVARGITTPEAYAAYTNPDLSAMHDPFLLHDMQAAVDRIQAAIQAGERITIYGDYDVDGLTATSIMKETLEGMGAEPTAFIPDRFTDGYGPNAAVYQYLRKSGTQLLITVDNGIAGKAVIDAAMAEGMDVIVTDHHELPEALPEAVAVVHPRYPGSDYPFGQLSGAGVAFKVATALLGAPPVDSIDLAALGTVADIVSLTDENRLIVQIGLAMMRTQPRVGLAALLAAASVDPAIVDETTIGFVIGPRLNALGRMGDANPGVTLLTTFDDDEATALATEINTLNTQRQQLVATITEQALAMANDAANAKRRTLILAHRDWHEGVLGIVASRVVEATGKPTLVLNIQEDGVSAKGSGRSVPAFNLFNALDAARNQLTAFGGHHMAAGLTVPVANLPAVATALETAAADSLAEAPRPPLELAGRLGPADLTLENYEALRALAPFGEGNREPAFVVRPTTVADIRQMGASNDHLKFQADGTAVLAFDYGAQAEALQRAAACKLAVRLDRNTWQNQTTLQLRLVDWQLDAPAVIDSRLPKPSAEQFRDAATYVFFDAKRMQALTRQFTFGGPTTLAADLPAGASNVVLTDLPPDEATLAAVMAKIARPVRVIFTAPAHELVALPTRQECAGVLRFLAAHPGFDKHQLPALAKSVHLTTHQAVLAVLMFSQLGFVTIDGAVIHVVPHPAKRALESAPAYQAQAAFLTLAHRLQTADRAALTALLFGDAD